MRSGAASFQHSYLDILGAKTQLHWSCFLLLLLAWFWVSLFLCGTSPGLGTRSAKGLTLQLGPDSGPDVNSTLRSGTTWVSMASTEDQHSDCFGILFFDLSHITAFAIFICTLYTLLHIYPTRHIMPFFNLQKTISDSLRNPLLKVLLYWF